MNQGDGAVFNQLTDVVEFHADMFHVWVAHMVLCQAMCSIVVTQERHGSRWGEAEASEEFTKEGKFMGGIVESNVFCIAG
jgi:hypothetical protein